MRFKLEEDYVLRASDQCLKYKLYMYNIN